jgi:hypothetical protein
MRLVDSIYRVFQKNSGQVGYERQSIENVWRNLNNSGVNVFITIIVLNELSLNDNFKKSLRTVVFLGFYENWRWHQDLNT